MWDRGRKGSEQDMVLVGGCKEGRKRQTTPNVFVCRDKLQTVIITIIIVPVEFHGGVTWVKVLGDEYKGSTESSASGEDLHKRGI